MTTPKDSKHEMADLPRLVADDRPPESLNDARHRIDADPHAQMRREDERRVSDGRCEEPRLREERDRVLHVAVAHVQRRQPQRDRDRRDDCEEDEERQEQHVQRRHDSVPREETGEHDEADGEVDEAG